MASEREASCAVRGLRASGGEVRVVGRSFQLDASGSMHSTHGSAQPSALDLLVSALVADLLAGLGRESARMGVALHDAELSVSAYLDNPLVALGVVGESGSAHVHTIRGSLYVSSDADAAVLADVWALACARSPVHSTLVRCSDVRIELKFVA